MPQKTFCRNCGKTLYEGHVIKPVGETILRFSGRCPYCGNTLVFKPEEITIKPIHTSFGGDHD